MSAATAATSVNDEMKCPKDTFCSAQLTATAREMVGDNPYIAATPAFNLKCFADNPQLEGSWDSGCFVNAVSFGVKINAACSNLMRLLKDSADEIHEPLPKYGFNSKARSKLHQITVLTKLAREKGYEQWANAVDRFVTVMNLHDERTITDSDAWARVLKTAGAPDDYADNLHYDRMHNLFPGITKDQLAELAEATHEYPSSDGQKIHSDTLRNYSLRWLSNAFKFWDLTGSQADLVNIIFAMMGEGVGSKDKISEEKVLSVLATMTHRLKTGDFSNLRVFERMVGDFEQDDRSAWILLRYINKCLGRECELVVLLPPNGEHKSGRGRKVFDFQPLAEHIVKNIQGLVIEDPDSRNADALGRQNRGIAK